VTICDYGFAMLNASFVRERVRAMSEEAVKITVRPNGPLRVEGHIILKDADGKEWDLTGKPAISLCRCGASEKRPFCDGSHNRVGFQCAASPNAVLT
jgi:CDGSH-type Zn-finger protein